jgi:hypothetical protein
VRGRWWQRQGALALLAGLDVHTGKVFASTPVTTGIKPFMDLAAAHAGPAAGLGTAIDYPDSG